MRPAVVAKLNALIPELYETVFWLTVVGVIVVFEVAAEQYWACTFVVQSAPTEQNARMPDNLRTIWSGLFKGFCSTMGREVRVFPG